MGRRCSAERIFVFLSCRPFSEFRVSQGVCSDFSMQSSMVSLESALLTDCGLRQRFMFFNGGLPWPASIVSISICRSCTHCTEVACFASVAVRKRRWHSHFFPAPRQGRVLLRQKKSTAARVEQIFISSRSFGRRILVCNFYSFSRDIFSSST